MARDDDRPLTRQQYRQLLDVFLLGIGALIGLTVVMLAMELSWWWFLAVAAGTAWVGWLGVQLQAVRAGLEDAGDDAGS